MKLTEIQVKRMEKLAAEYPLSGDYERDGFGVVRFEQGYKAAFEDAQVLVEALKLIKGLNYSEPHLPEYKISNRALKQWGEK